MPQARQPAAFDSPEAMGKFSFRGFFVSERKYGY